MLKTFWLLAAAAFVPSFSGCVIGLPHGPIGAPLGSVPIESECCEACECVPERPIKCACNGCPLLPPVSPQPPYIDPGPPGRFFPVPVRPVFQTQAPYPELLYPLPPQPE